MGHGHEDILKYLNDIGYATKTQIMEHFQTDDSELITMNLEFLLDNQNVKKVRYASSTKEDDLFYVLPK